MEGPLVGVSLLNTMAEGQKFPERHTYSVAAILLDTTAMKKTANLSND
jgi:hypothetical protein